MVSLVFDANNLGMRHLFGKDVVTYKKGSKTEVEKVDYELWKYRFIDSIYKSIFRVKDTREIILAVDDPKSWRKLYWTRYKSHRKSKRESIDLDWNEYYKVFDSFLEEIRTYLPIKVIRAKQAEADDVIGVIVLNKPQSFHIISTDKDFLQLCSPNVVIYNPLKREEVRHPNPEIFLVEQCLMGQAKDNIYNIKTPLDHDETKKKPGFGEVACEKVLSYGWEKWLVDNNLQERYNFNSNLMDFRKIPKTIVNRILSTYNNYERCNLDNIQKFFKIHPWPEYVDNFTTVENKLMEVY